LCKGAKAVGCLFLEFSGFGFTKMKTGTGKKLSGKQHVHPDFEYVFHHFCTAL
jgi:hypothetical protein